jgi:hypothetical protein
MQTNDFPIEDDILYDCLERGMTIKDMSDTFDISCRRISKKMADIQSKQGILTQYRSLQSLQLTELQARVLENITPEKLAEAPLRDLMYAFKVLKENELVLDGKPTELKGLVGYLIQLEKEEVACNSPVEATDAEFQEIESPELDPSDPNWVPNL